MIMHKEIDSLRDMVIATSGDSNIHYYQIISLRDPPYNVDSNSAYIDSRTSEYGLNLRGLFIIDENNAVSLI
jgi:hypothetical protein